MKIKPCELRDANTFIEKLHRHHKKVQGHRFSLALWNDEKLIGVVCVGRPVARMTDASKVLEVTRLCTDGTKNACSMLYSAAARVGKEMGYERIQTFILENEPGISLIATGWKKSLVSSGGSWDRPSRERIDKAPLDKKIRYEKALIHFAGEVSIKDTSAPTEGAGEIPAPRSNLEAKACES